MRGPVLLEFGASWCGHCLALAPTLAHLLEGHPDVHLIKVEDGPGQPLGRSFRVKLWPTLVFLKDWRVVKQVARPGLGEIREGLTMIAGARSGPSGQTISVLGYRVVDRCPVAFDALDRVKPLSWMATHPPTMNSLT